MSLRLRLFLWTQTKTPTAQKLHMATTGRMPHGSAGILRLSFLQRTGASTGCTIALARRSSLTATSILQRINGTFAHVPRCGEIRFADPQRYNIISACNQIKKFTDTALGQIPDRGYDKRFCRKNAVVFRHKYLLLGKCFNLRADRQTFSFFTLFQQFAGYFVLFELKGRSRGDNPVNGGKFF